MSILIKPILADKFTFAGFLLSILLLLGIRYIIFSYIHLPPFLPLYNKLPWGYERLGEKSDIFIPIILSFAFLIGNIYSILMFTLQFPFYQD